MSVYEVFEKLQHEVDEAASVPLTAKVMIDKDVFLDLLDELREMLPPEVIQAQKVLEDADNIINNAQTEAAGLIAGARKEAENIITEARRIREEVIEASDITKESRQRAEELMRATKKASEDLTTDTQNKVESLIKKAKVDAYKIRAGSLDQSKDLMENVINVLASATEIIEEYKFQIEKSKESLVATVKKKSE